MFHNHNLRSQDFVINIRIIQMLEPSRFKFFTGLQTDDYYRMPSTPCGEHAVSTRDKIIGDVLPFKQHERFRTTKTIIITTTDLFWNVNLIISGIKIKHFFHVYHIIRLTSQRGECHAFITVRLAEFLETLRYHIKTVISRLEGNPLLYPFRSRGNNEFYPVVAYRAQTRNRLSRNRT